jgi:hypothetical protein
MVTFRNQIRRVPPERQFGLLAVRLTSGLCNRLRTLAGFVHVNERLGLPALQVFWHGNCDACPGSFDDLFVPCSESRIEFIDLERFRRLEEDRACLTFWGQADINQTCKAFAFEPLTFGEVAALYAGLFVPLPHIAKSVREFRKEFKLGECCGLHIRRTDHPPTADALGGHTPDSYFMRIIEEASSTRFFLATDNAATQQLFTRMAVGRVLVFRPIDFHVELHCLPPKNLRHTTLQHALIDLLLLACCSHIEGSFLSSFSDAAKIFQPSIDRLIGLEGFDV